jgi:cell division protein FtsZ
MLEIPRTSKTSTLSLTKVVGVGNAGVNLVDRLTIERSFHLETVAINTDLQSLVSSVADSKVPIGEKATRGLGTGGDPEIGTDAAYESQTTLQSVLEDTALVIVCAGLGGGTGSGTLPILLEGARSSGALTTVILTLPFSFEGRRRMQQAKDALEKIRPHADALLIFENDRMSENAQPKLGIGETFAESDLFLTQAAISIARLVSGIGPLQLTPGDLATVLRPNLGISLFGFGQAEGDHRAHNALKRALENPLLDRGRLLDEAKRLLIHIDGASDLLLSEVQAIVQEISTACTDSTHILLGINTSGPSYPSGAAPASITVSLLGTCFQPHEISIPEKKLIPAAAPLPLADTTTTSLPIPPPEQVPIPQELLPLRELIPKTIDLSTQESFSPAELITAEPQTIEYAVETQPEHFTHLNLQPSEAIRKAPLKPKQEVLQFEPIARGRFEKSEPTIVEGEDIDVPTFLRMKIKVK